MGCRAFGVACVSDPGPARPAIDDFTSKEAAIVGLAKLTDASEVRRVLQVVAEADNPPTLDLSLDQQRAKRSLQAVRPGEWDVGDHRCSTRSTGDPGCPLASSFTRSRTPDTTTPAQRRALMP